MGAWGAGPFENDDAADWVSDLEESSDESVIAAALNVVSDLAPDEYLEAPDASLSLAAAEVVAAVFGSPCPGLPDEVSNWIAGSHAALSPDLVDRARAAVDRVSTNSELKELWDEAGDRQWLANVFNLQARLASVGS
jgi:hypothetical protein